METVSVVRKMLPGRVCSRVMVAEAKVVSRSGARVAIRVFFCCGVMVGRRGVQWRRPASGTVFRKIRWGIWDVYRETKKGFQYAIPAFRRVSGMVNFP
jgi:hypothetical protein